MRGFTMTHTVVLWLSESLLYWLHSHQSGQNFFLSGTSRSWCAHYSPWTSCPLRYRSGLLLTQHSERSAQTDHCEQARETSRTDLHNEVGCRREVRLAKTSPVEGAPGGSELKPRCLFHAALQGSEKKA